MTNRLSMRRAVSALICLCFVAMILTSSALFISHSSICAVEHCAVCLTIQSLHSALSTLIALALGWLIAVGLSARIRHRILGAARFSWPVNLVTQNIRMNN